MSVFSRMEKEVPMNKSKCAPCGVTKDFESYLGSAITRYEI